MVLSLSKSALIVQLFLWFSLSAFAQKDSLTKVLLSNPTQEEKSKTLNALSTYLLGTNPDSAIALCNEAVNIAKEIDNPTLLADAHFNLGMIHYLNEAFPLAVNHFITAKTSYPDTESAKQYKTNLQLALTYKELGDDLNAIDELENLKSDLVKSNSSGLIYTIYLELGNLYFKVGKKENAKINYSQSISYAKSINDSIATAGAYLKYCKKLLEENMLAELKLNIKEVSAFLENSNISSEVGLLKASLFIKENNFEIAEQTLNTTLLRANEENNTVMVAESFRLLSEVYEKQGKYALALLSYKDFHKLMDSINNTVSGESLSDLKTKYANSQLTKEVEYSQLETAKNRAEKEKLDEELNNERKRFQLIALIGSLLLLLIAGMTWGFIRQKKLSRKLNFLSKVAESTSNSVIITDEEGNVQWVNDSYKNITGLDKAGFIAKYGQNIFESSPNNYVQEKLAKLKEDNTPQEYYLDLDDRDKVIKTSASPQFSNGKLTGYVLLDTDVSELVEAEKQLNLQHQKLIKSNNQIRDSIDYAQRIQESILPRAKKINQYFQNHVILYLPKDVIAGDFYFLERVNEYIYFAGADCTGHGVPGALMSVLSHNLLEAAVHDGTPKPCEVLYKLNNLLIKKLKQSVDGYEDIKDGLDITMCRVLADSLGSEEMIVEMASARNGCFHITDGELLDYKGDKIHIGDKWMEENPFTHHSISIKRGECIYLFSDGWPDQKGERSNKKYYYPPFRKFILKISENSAQKQEELMKEELKSWRGNLPQGDDIFVWGIQF